jgi:molybdate-binding protein
LYGDNYSINLDINQHFARYEDSLWDESEEETEAPVYRVKKRKDKNIHYIDVMNKKKIVYTLDCSKLGKRNYNFIISVEGMQFVLEQFKKGIKSLNGLKKELKQRKYVKTDNKK